jgi:DNA polymerase elongation subunit (family B)
MYQNIFVSPRTQEEPPVVYVWDDEKGLLVSPYKEFDYAYRKDPMGAFTSIYGHRLKKVHVWDRDDADVFESDVPRETRVLTDLYLDSDDLSKNHVIGIFDIEVASEGGFADLNKADQPILSIAFLNQTKNHFVTFVLDEQKRLKDHMKDDVAIVRFDTEFDMLEAFMAWYSDQGFTILTGWNLTGFDVTYLYRRITKIVDEHTANMLSPIGMLKWSKMRERYQIAGVSVLDYLEMYKKFTYITKPNYRLDTIGMLEVDMGKVELGMTIDDIYEQDIDKFLEYNIHDVRIVDALDKKMKLIDLVQNICHAGHVQYEDYMYSSKFIEGTILVYLHRKGIICPNKPIDGQEQMKKKDEAREEGFEGAFVKDPQQGLHEWVYSLDLQSLYPSIIMSLNISPETKVGKVHDWDVEKHMKQQISEYKVEVQSDEFTFSRDEFVAFMEKMRFDLSSNGIIYMTEQTGVIPEILDQWFNQRIEFKKLMKKYANEGNKELANYYDKRQHVQKIFLNSIYGVLGLPIFRFYDIDNALAVTATGQDVIKTSARIVNKLYHDRTKTDKDYCIYIDTDSLYFPALEGNKESCKALAQEVEDFLNNVYDSMARNMFFCDDHRLYIKGETISRRGFWVTKKRYALWQIYDLETNMDTDKIKIKGLDIVRSSFPPAFAKFMSQTIDNILHGKDKEYIDETIHRFHMNIDNVSYLDIAKNTSVQNLEKFDNKSKSTLEFKKGTPAHVKSALTYNRLLKKKKWDRRHGLIKSGDKIKWTYLKDNPLQIPAIAVKGFDDPKELIEFVEEYIDREKLFDNELKKKLDDFYTALSWGNIPTEVNQFADEFFSF